MKSSRRPAEFRKCVGFRAVVLSKEGVQNMGTSLYHLYPVQQPVGL